MSVHAFRLSLALVSVGFSVAALVTRDLFFLAGAVTCLLIIAVEDWATR